MNTETAGYKAHAFEARNLLIFFLIALVYPLLLGGLNYVGILKMPSGIADPNLIPFLIVAWPAILGPTFAAFVTAAITEGKPGVKALWARFWNRRLSVRWLLVAVLCLPVLRLLGGILTQILSKPPFPLLAEGGISAVGSGILLGLFCGLKEEFGWRGYALPRFQAKWNALTSGLVLGVITGVWHLPAFFMPGEPLFGQDLGSWFAWHMLIQVVNTWIFNNTDGNVLALVLFHTTTSLGIFNVDWLYIGILLLVAVLIVAICGPKSLVRQGRGQLVAQPGVEAVGAQPLIR